MTGPASAWLGPEGYVAKAQGYVPSPKTTWLVGLGLYFQTDPSLLLSLLLSKQELHQRTAGLSSKRHPL